MKKKFLHWPLVLKQIHSFYCQFMFFDRPLIRCSYLLDFNNKQTLVYPIKINHKRNSLEAKYEYMAPIFSLKVDSLPLNFFLAKKLKLIIYQFLTFHKLQKKK